MMRRGLSSSSRRVEARCSGRYLSCKPSPPEKQPTLVIKRSQTEHSAKANLTFASTQQCFFPEMRFSVLIWGTDCFGLNVMNVGFQLFQSRKQEL